MVELADEAEESFTVEYVLFLCATQSHVLGRQRREFRVFQSLLHLVPGLEERIMNQSEEEIVGIADLACLL